jgi:hypothetical protein
LRYSSARIAVSAPVSGSPPILRFIAASGCRYKPSSNNPSSARADSASRIAIILVSSNVNWHNIDVVKRLPWCIGARSGSDRIRERIFALIGCALIVLSFSVTNPHNFSNHFRVPKAPRSSVRNFFVAQGEDGKAESVVQLGRDRAPGFSIETECNISLIVDLKTPDYATPSKRVRFHRKLSSPSSNSEEAHI